MARLVVVGAVLWTLALLLAVVHAWTSSDVAVLEKFEFTGESHVAFGRAIGERFKDKIQARIAANIKLQTRLLPFVQTTTQGKAAYDLFITSHEATFPDYVDELRGIAEGSGVPFETVFVMNLSEEFDDIVPKDFTRGAGSRRAHEKTLRCSDIVLVGGPQQLRAVAHNEDGDVADMNHTAIITAKVGTRPQFVAYTYLGDLPSGAFGFNDKGVAFTLNFVQPADGETGGLGRGFISRDLLVAVDNEDAFRRIARPHQASGHNYQLMDVATARIWNVEAASLNRLASQELLPPADHNQTTVFFHANQYQLLNIAQPPYDSSIHRLKRFSELPKPTSVQEALHILGDQHDRLYPVFHDVLSHERGELSGWTLTTIVFDLVKKQAVSYRGNPRHGLEEFHWDLATLKVEKVDTDRASTA